MSHSSGTDDLVTARLTSERLAEIRARLEAATPGEWTLTTEDAVGRSGAHDVCTSYGPRDLLTIQAPVRCYENAGNDMALLVHAPAYLDEVLRELDLMRADATATLEAAARDQWGSAHTAPDDCPTWYDWCNCTVPNLLALADTAERERDLLAETARRLTGERDAAREDAHRLQLLQEWGESKYDDFGFTIVEVSYDEDEDAHNWSVTGPSAAFGHYGAEGATLAEAVDAAEEYGRNRPTLDDLLAAQAAEDDAHAE